MTDNSSVASERGCTKILGLRQLGRTLGLAVHPPKLGLAFGAIVLTLGWGGLLDYFGYAVRNSGVGEKAVSSFIETREHGGSYEEPAGAAGVFRVWMNHERRCVIGLLSWGIANPDGAVDVGIKDGPVAGLAAPLGYVAHMWYGVWWLLQYHFWFFVLFATGGLFIWSVAGGAICRLAAVQFAREEKLALIDGLSYAREKLFGGFLLGPLLPIIFMISISLAMLVGGAVLWIPFVGDLLGGVLFPLAIVGGACIALLFIGLVMGGSLFWPVVATEGSDAFDAFSRSFSYFFTKPWKTVWYALVLFVYACVCWTVVRFVCYLSLALTQGIVGFGTSLFGLIERDAEGQVVSKLQVLWPFDGQNALHAGPDWAQLGWHEHISAVLIWFWVLATIGLVWSFLVSFYFSGCTVAYHLLRCDVDGIDLEAVYMGEASDKEGDDDDREAAKADTKGEESTMGDEDGEDSPPRTDQPD